MLRKLDLRDVALVGSESQYRAVRPWNVDTLCR